MPGCSMLYGDLPRLLANIHRMNDYFLETHALVGGGSYQVLLPGSGPIINLAPDVRNMEWMLGVHADRYAKDPTQLSLYRDLLGHGIFASDGDDWRVERKVASHLFSTRVLRDTLASATATHADAICETLDRQSSGGAPVEMQALFYHCTAATFLETGFGVPYTSRTATVMNAFDRVGEGLFSRYVRPLWRLQRLLGIGVERQVSADLRILDTFATECIANARSQDTPSSPDLLSLCIRDGLAKGVQRDDVYLRDVVFNFVLAGRDTTASLLTWTVYRLMKHPSVYARCIEEIEAVLKTDPDGRLGYRGAASCTYLDAVLHEVLRLHPPVPNDMKYCADGDILPDGTVVPAGSTIAYRPYVFGRSSRLWENPDVFDPGRWHQKKISPYKFIAFNAGRRICLGRHSALMQAKIVLSVLLPKYTFSPHRSYPDGVDPVWRPAAVLAMRDGLEVLVRMRST